MELANIFNLQANIVTPLTEYQNEFETMRSLFDALPEKSRRAMQELSLLWLDDLEQNENIEYDLKDNCEKVRESNKLRQEGNRLFTAKADKRNVLGACRLYNDAIYAALDSKGDELALGFANRAMALQNFGYYQQAYDDCCYALKLGYPESLRHKVVMRQAFCSIKMNKLETAEKHLNELKVLRVSESFSKELNNLSVAFDEQQKVVDLDDNTNTFKRISLNRDSQEITTTTSAGRCMQAKCHIEKDELIFTERACAFVPVGDTRRMCHQCGTLNFIPLPCLECRGRVNYCSIKCLEKHASIHVYECRAYRMQLFAHVGIAHLALRTVFDNGIFTVLDDLKLENSTSTLWQRLCVDGDIWNDHNKQYAESLRMISHLKQMPKKEIQWFAFVSHLLVVYLKRWTRYFDDLMYASKNIDWELLTGSLILRHIGQLISNGHTLTAIIPLPLSYMTSTDFHLLNENVWSSPWHLKLGCLNFFSNYDDIASLNLPYLSLCNHSCVQLFTTKFSGRFISTYALRDIKQGEEITNCYDVDYRKSKRNLRRKRLQQSYHFDCQCENCMQAEFEDEEFNKFYQYRCDNVKCGKVFVSSSPEINRLDLLQSDLTNSKVDTNLYCTVCGHRQTLKWYREITDLMSSITETRSRRRLYDIFKESEQYLLGLNKARRFIAQKMVYELFNMFWINCALDDQDYCNMIELIKYILSVTRELSSVNSTDYIIYMILLWDLIARQKYKCSKAEMDEMLWAINFVADDLKVIFLNYYNDYMKEYLCLEI